MDRREDRKKHRVNYPSSADSPQMLHDANPPVVAVAGPSRSSPERSSHERADSKEKEYRGGEGDRLRRQTPPAEGAQNTSSPRLQNRGSNQTPTKHLTSSQSTTNRAHQSNVRKINLEKIRREIQPFKGPVGKESVDKKMLEELINSYGYSEVRLFCKLSAYVGTVVQDTLTFRRVCRVKTLLTIRVRLPFAYSVVFQNLLLRFSHSTLQCSISSCLYVYALMCLLARPYLPNGGRSGSRPQYVVALMCTNSLPISATLFDRSVLPIPILCDTVS